MGRFIGMILKVLKTRLHLFFNITTTSRLPLVFLLVGCINVNTFAIAYTWFGGTSNAWEVPGNWKIGGTISTTTYPINNLDDVTINITNATVLITGTTDITIKSLNIYNGATINLGSNNINLIVNPASTGTNTSIGNTSTVGTITGTSGSFTINSSVAITAAFAKAHVVVPVTVSLSAGTTNFSSNSVFDASVTVNSAQLNVGSSTFNAASNFTKSGTGTNTWSGNNTFVGSVTLNNTGTGVINTANSVVDTYTSNLTVLTGSGATIALGNAAVSGTSSLGGVLTATGDGTMNINNLVQSGILANSVTVNSLAIRGSTFPGGGTFTASNITEIKGNTIGTTGNTTIITNTGAYAYNRLWSGGNTFNGTTSIINSGATPIFTANTTPDIYNGDLTLRNTSGATGGITLSYLFKSTVNGNLVLDNGGISSVIYLAKGAAAVVPTPTLAIPPDVLVEVSGDITVSSSSTGVVSLGNFFSVLQKGGTRNGQAYGTLSTGGFSSGSLQTFWFKQVCFDIGREGIK